MQCQQSPSQLKLRNIKVWNLSFNINNSFHYYFPSPVLSSWHMLSHLICTIKLWDRLYYNFSEEKNHGSARMSMLPTTQGVKKPVCQSFANMPIKQKKKPNVQLILTLPCHIQSCSSKWQNTKLNTARSEKCLSWWNSEYLCNIAPCQCWCLKAYWVLYLHTKKFENVVSNVPLAVMCQLSISLRQTRFLKVYINWEGVNSF